MGTFGFLHRLFRYLRPYRLSVIFITLGMFIDLAYDSFLQLSFKFLLDDAITPRNYHMLLLIILALILGALLAASTAIARDYLYASLGTNVLNDLRIRLFEHLQSLSMGYFSRAQLGDLLSRFSTDLPSIENAIILAVPSAVMASLGLCISVVLLFLLQWKLALLAAIGLVVVFYSTHFLEGPASRLGYQFKEEQAKTSVFLHENLGAQAIIKGFSLQENINGNFHQLLNRLLKIALRANFASYLLERVPNVGTMLLNIAVLGAGAVMAFHGKMTIGSLVSFNALFAGVSTAVYNIASILPSLVQAAAGMQRIEDVLNEVPGVIDPPEPELLPPLSQSITFHDVTFSYTGEQINLHQVNLSIQAGWTVAFVGPSGSGKSTALNLITRFYDPKDGTVQMDGHDLRKVSQQALHEQMSIVFQESLLFNTSIRENIRMGRLTATDAEIVSAAEQAGINEFIDRLPNGYDTVVGERGEQLSGGQRQRVAIARAMVRNPRILILDEATSALDPATEAAVNHTIEQLRGGLTVVSVTHRLAPIIHSDCIFVFESGRLAEHGTHDDLLQKDGLYSRLWEKQNGFVLSAEGDRAEVTGERLKKMPILEALDEPLLLETARLFVTEQYFSDREIIKEGDRGDKFYIIVRGRVAVLKTMTSGEEKKLAILEDGDHFGEIALLHNVTRTATIRTLTPGLFLTLQREQLWCLLEKAPLMRQRMEEILQERIKAH